VKVRQIILALLAASGCASVPKNRADAYSGTWAADGCEEANSRPCCAFSEAQARAAYERGDDQTGDEELERLALTCPGRRAGALRAFQPKDVAAEWRPGLVGLNFVYQVDLGADDSVMWLAAYFDRARAQRRVAAGRQVLEVQVHLLAGDRVVKLQRRDVVDLSAGAARVTIKIARVAGADPFRLEVAVSPRAVTVGVGGGVAPAPSSGTATASGSSSAPVAAPPKPPRSLRRKPAPDFAPPAEWLDGQAPPLRVMILVNREAHIGYLDLWACPHPRLTGALLDWLRRFEYEVSLADWPANQLRGDGLIVAFDRPSFPAPSQYP
jgi:hypothetical protein